MPSHRESSSGGLPPLAPQASNLPPDQMKAMATQQIVGWQGPREVWVAFYNDLSDVVVFLTEVEALRYAVERDGMRVARMEPGVSLADWIRGKT